MTDKNKPTYIGHRNRLRSKFCKMGLEGLLEHEIIEFLLTYAIARKDVKPIAWDLLKKFGSLKSILQASPEQLATIKGLGENTICFFSLLKAIGQKYTEQTLIKQTLQTPQQIIPFAKSIFDGKEEEQLVVLFLSAEQSVISSQIIAKGENNFIKCSTRKIMEEALKIKANSIILLHNHPSGNTLPSNGDIEFTKKVVSAATLLGIVLLDHIIVGTQKIYSLKLEKEFLF